MKATVTIVKVKDWTIISLKNETIISVLSERDRNIFVLSYDSLHYDTRISGNVKFRNDLNQNCRNVFHTECIIIIKTLYITTLSFITERSVRFAN